MKQLVFKGVIKNTEYGDNYDALFIGDMEQPLAMYFEEELQNKQVTVRYWLGKKEATKEQLTKSFLISLFGVVDSEYRSVYSEYTGYLWTDENLKIGGHDLFAELQENKGKFLYLEVDMP